MKQSNIQDIQGDVVNHGTEQDNEEFPEKDNEIFIINPEGEFILTKNWEMTGRFIEKTLREKIIYIILTVLIIK